GRYRELHCHCIGGLESTSKFRAGDSLYSVKLSIKRKPIQYSYIKKKSAVQQM
ncbi:Hypothetical predicted protein, partial [Paramuricea clavata]